MSGRLVPRNDRVPARQGTTGGVNRAQGIHGDGGRNYTAAQARRVFDCMKASTTMTVEDIADATGVHGRAVRDIIRDYDGVWYLIGGNDGYQLCEFADDGNSLTLRLHRQVRTMMDRLERRARFAQTLPRRQAELFSEEKEGDELT